MTDKLSELADCAYRIRRYALRMGEVQGQGYIGQALGMGEILAVAYGHALNLKPEDPEWEAPDPEAWRGTVHLQEWPEDLAGPEYWLYKKQGEEEQ